MRLAQVSFWLQRGPFNMGHQVVICYGRKNEEQNTLWASRKVMYYSADKSMLQTIIENLQKELLEKFKSRLITAEQAFGNNKGNWPYYANGKLNSGLENEDWLLEDYEDEEVMKYIISVAESVELKEIVSNAHSYSPLLIVWREKHGDVYEAATTPAAVSKLFLNKMKERFDDGWYDWMLEQKNQLKAPKFTREEVEALPDSFADQREGFLEQIQKFEKKTKEVMRYFKVYEDIKKALKESDGRKAIRLMSQMKNHEYENFNVEPLAIY